MRMMKYMCEMERVHMHRVVRMFRGRKFIKDLYYVEGDIDVVLKMTDQLLYRLAKPIIVVRVTHWTQGIDLPRLTSGSYKLFATYEYL